MKLLKIIWELLKKTYDQAGQINIGLHGAAIAFYAIFSTAPLVIITLWILNMVIGSQLGTMEVEQTMESVVGAELTDTIEQIVASANEGTSGLWSSIVAIITLLFGATTLLSQIKQTLNVIWGVKNPKLNSVWLFLWDRLTGLLFIGALSLLFLTGLVSESIIYGLGDLLIPVLGSTNVYLIQIGTSLTNVVLAITFFAAMFRILPDLDARWRDVAVGAIVTTVLVLAGKSLVDWYLSAAALEPMYKAAGSFVIFLIWIYYNVQVVLIGAVFTRVYTSRYGGKIKPYWEATLDEDLWL
ncbi:YihY/virulence factor BrkB family protein [Fodinibius sp.]|uniref:YihY/virulence factor BrkB family protein n=1 Tax=Fodinibius sp. TaxID=1872440 RepID=UPI002ACEF0C9|nr:YihY/virulence factor BrkB family protein [Fodinibius sp.]MDZ7658377.1 YihY/virulence factor BrkB family protein [Fodinibius sp.]